MTDPDVDQAIRARHLQRVHEALEAAGLDPEDTTGLWSIPTSDLLEIHEKLRQEYVNQKPSKRNEDGRTEPAPGDPEEPDSDGSD